GHASLASWPEGAEGWTLTGWLKLEDLAAVESPYRVMMAAGAGTQETISLWASDEGEIGFFSEPAQNDLILLADHELFDTWLFFEVTKDAGANTGRLRLWSSGGVL